MSLKSGTKINRLMYQYLTTEGDAVDCTVTSRKGSVDITSDGNSVAVEVYAREDGVDIRVHDLHFIVKKQSITVLQQHPPYPIAEWTVLWQGEME